MAPDTSSPIYASPTAHSALWDLARANGITQPLNHTSPPPSPQATRRTRKMSSTIPSGAAAIARLAIEFTKKLSILPDATAENDLADDDDDDDNDDLRGETVGNKGEMDADSLYFSNLNANDTTPERDDKRRGKPIRPRFRRLRAHVRSPTPIPAPAYVSPTQATREKGSGPTSAIMNRSSSWAASYPTFLLDYRTRFGQGGMSESFLARIILPPTGERAGMAFVKHIAKDPLVRNRNFSEIRAYERVSEVGVEKLRYVANMEAFVDKLDLAFYILIFRAYAFDLYWIINVDESAHDELVKANSKIWFAQIATGIRDLHNIGIIHRDIKPENVLIDWNGDAHITDLGLAYVHPECKPLKYTQSYCYQICGTTSYIAPEIKAVGREYSREQEYEWLLNDPEELKGMAKLYGPGVDWSSFGTMMYGIVACPTDSTIEVLSSEDRRAIARVLNARSAYLFAQRMKARGVPDSLRDLLFSLWAPPSKRGNYATCYKSEFFYDQKFNEPTFDLLPYLVTRSPTEDVSSKKYAQRNLHGSNVIQVDYAYADPDLHGEKINVSWIRPNTELFNVQ